MAGLGTLVPVVSGAAEEELFIRKIFLEWETESREGKRVRRGERNGCEIRKR